MIKVSQFGDSKYCTPNQYRHRQLSGSQTHEKKNIFTFQFDTRRCSGRRFRRTYHKRLTF